MEDTLSEDSYELATLIYSNFAIGGVHVEGNGSLTAEENGNIVHDIGGVRLNGEHGIVNVSNEDTVLSPIQEHGGEETRSIYAPVLRSIEYTITGHRLNSLENGVDASLVSLGETNQ